MVLEMADGGKNRKKFKLFTFAHLENQLRTININSIQFNSLFGHLGTSTFAEMCYMQSLVFIWMCTCSNQLTYDCQKQQFAHWAFDMCQWYIVLYSCRKADHRLSTPYSHPVCGLFWIMYSPASVSLTRYQARALIRRKLSGVRQWSCLGSLSTTRISSQIFLFYWYHNLPLETRASFMYTLWFSSLWDYPMCDDIKIVLYNETTTKVSGFMEMDALE